MYRITWQYRSEATTNEPIAKTRTVVATESFRCGGALVPVEVASILELVRDAGHELVMLEVVLDDTF